MEGLIKEGQEVLDEDGEGPVIDAALISAARRIEHYEMSGYESACELAEQLDLDDVKALLEETMSEEISAEALLGEVAANEVYPAASGHSEEEGEDEEPVAARKTSKVKSAKSGK